MLTPREQFRNVVARQLGERGLTREQRWNEVLVARRCRNVFWNAMGPTVFGFGSPADIIVQAQTQPFGIPTIVTDILNFDEIYVTGFYQGIVWELMRVFTSGVGFLEDFFGAGNFTDSLMTLGHYQSNVTADMDGPSLKMHFMPYLSPIGQIFQINWELLDFGALQGAINTFSLAAGGAGYTLGDILTILGVGNANATVEVTALTANGAILTSSLGSGGAGYTALDVLTVTGGDGTATFRVDTVALGVITGVTLLTAGSGYSAAAGVATTGGTGAGATINILTVSAGQVSAISIVSRGSGYTAPQAAVATSGGTGAGATVNVLTVSAAARTQYNPEADFRGIQVLDKSDPYSQVCGRLFEKIDAAIKDSDPETFILDLEIPTASLPAAGLTALFTTPLQERPLLIYGIATNINGAQIRMKDQSVQWDFVRIPKMPTQAINVGVPQAGAYPAMDGIPINVVAGNADLTYHEAYNMLPVPHLLEPSTALSIRLTNGLRPTGVGGAYAQSINTVSNLGNSTGNGHIAFLCRTV